MRTLFCAINHPHPERAPKARVEGSSLPEHAPENRVDVLQVIAEIERLFDLGIAEIFFTSLSFFSSNAAASALAEATSNASLELKEAAN